MTQAKPDPLKRDVPTSVGPYSDEFLDETIKVWQPRYPGRKLNHEDAREIAVNLTGFFFQVPMEWEQNDRLHADDRHSGSAS